MVNFNFTVNDEYALITFSINESLDTSELERIHPPDAIKESFAHKGVVLNGRGPVWLYCFLTHYYHPTKFIATYDPRLQGAVVVQSHGAKFKIGELIPIDNNELVSEN